MAHTIARVMLLAVALVTTAAATTPTPPTTTNPPPTPPPAQVPVTAAANTQTEVLAYLIAIDEHLVAMAEQALTKKLEPKLRELALSLRADSRETLAVTRALVVDAKVTLVDTTTVTASREQDRTDLEQLGKVPDADYGSAFLKALIAKDGYALDLIDKRLLADATDERIVQHMQALRTRIAAHQLRAQELQSAGK